MGSGIAEVAARAGCRVRVHEQSEELVEAGRRRVEASLERALRADKLSADERDEALERLEYATELSELSDRQLVIEAVVENEAAKFEVFRALDAALSDPDAILASNTSSIPIMKLAAQTGRPERVCGLHFFNPVPVLRLVELIRSLATSDDTATRLEEFARERLGRVVIHAPDRAGFVVNALLVPYLLSAIRMLESGFASAEDIDTGMVHGCSHPIGPLRLCDLIGLDTVRAVADSMFEEYREPLYAPPPLLSRTVEAGRLGRKTGRGFYDYAK
ncbi:MAG: 3-hydroxybutyryl-CoA dehydrogenase [Proteobacteria bacterium]|nr:3-hydroxybutyryl-CoA dehydrogenase [Pseudomonadota bacterium]